MSSLAGQRVKSHWIGHSKDLQVKKLYNLMTIYYTDTTLFLLLSFTESPMNLLLVEEVTILEISEAFFPHSVFLNTIKDHHRNIGISAIGKVPCAKATAAQRLHRHVHNWCRTTDYKVCRSQKARHHDAA